MPNEKTIVDQWVRREIEKLEIDFTEQTSSIKEVKVALKNASKQGGMGSGKPEFVFLVNDTLVVVEDKPSTSNLILLDEHNEVDLSIPKATANYAVNGAVHYAKHIVEKTTNFKEVIAIGATGTSDSRGVLVYLVSNNGENTNIKSIGSLPDWSVLSLIKFDEWYGVNVLGNLSKDQKDELELKKVAAQLHEDLRNYASLEGENKATVVSAILLALDSKKISIDELKGHKRPTDGARIYRSIKDYMEDKDILPEEKRNIVLNKFNFIQTNVALNEKRKDLGVTPLHYFASILQKDVLDHFKNNTEFDILGNFYGEFVKYGDSDGNGLGIVLTPKHITSLMAELIQIGRNDYVLDPTAGSGAFLISAMNRMMKEPLTEGSINTNSHIKQHQLFGIEMQEKMYTVATTNMILRGDGKSNLMLANMFSKKSDDFINDGSKVPITKVLMNPPYSQGSKGNFDLYEINFIKHALDISAHNGKLAVIVPQSTMTGKSKVEREMKQAILEHHTLDAVITLNPNTFHGQRAGVQPVVALFAANQPHPVQKQVKFINFKDDGWVVKKHLGLQDDGTASQKRKQLVDTVLYDVPMETSFMVKSQVTSEDEWLHSYFYFNDSIPKPEAFEKTVQDYLAFKFDQTVHGRGYLFDEWGESTKK
ncbi:MULTISPECIES: N-6 DNA methylase [unclassified Enterococcus]|uniref:HsdM family class I SAM-dependent methyltransferase n=1 Tax=unclassified Enterococcus TaxID=2608891 RepID=UPI0015560222|nr:MULTISPECIES: N-6 DNA methylase [unclassified Enterococcus]NPD13365.1 N-6 DNA methylase [Enterococcus sp. MMGLQ5-1]NPD38298.1 N-6 DNA methylase [Enterococcus sp. MMGLQ5-2]